MNAPSMNSGNPGTCEEPIYYHGRPHRLQQRPCGLRAGRKCAACGMAVCSTHRVAQHWGHAMERLK